MDTKESFWDKKLKINTCGRDDSMEDAHHFPYEPTPYSVLERLAETGYLTEENTLVDYGCGKGRAGIYLSYRTGCSSVGVEFDADLWACAEANRKTCLSAKRVAFYQANAEEYEVDVSADTFYFFNPFSVNVLQRVIGKIRESWYRQPRNLIFFFYYPSDEYVAYLMTVPELGFLDEIDCSDLFSGENTRERILVFEM